MKNNMNVLELCLSSGYGGLELYMAKVAAYLSVNNQNVSIVVSGNSFLDKRFTELNLDRSYIKVRFYHFPIIAAFKLARYICKNKIDLIHVHHGKDLFLCVLAKVIAKRGKLVYTRQMAITRYKHDLYHRFLYRNVDMCLIITKALLTQALKYLPIDKERVQLLYYGVPQPPAGESDCKNYYVEKGIDQAAVKVAIFGRIEEIKGQHLVVEAVSKLIAGGDPLQAALIGHVMDKKYYDELINIITGKNLQKSILYLGFHRNPVSIMSCFDIVVLATRCETFGLVLPEAMRAGVCVVGTDCGGVPEIITHGKTGLLFQPDDADDLAKQLHCLISDVEYRKTLADGET